MQRKVMRRQDGTLDRREQEAPPDRFAPLSQDEEARLFAALPSAHCPRQGHCFSPRCPGRSQRSSAQQPSRPVCTA